MKTMRLTLLVGASMFALMSGAYAQISTNVSLEVFQSNWQTTNNVTIMTPELYEQMKTEWVTTQVLTVNERAIVEASLVPLTQAEKDLVNDQLLRAEMGVPADYPLMQNTGNLALDIDNYVQAKEAWIQANPAAYNQMITTPTLTDGEIQEIRQQEMNNQNQ